MGLPKGKSVPRNIMTSFVYEPQVPSPVFIVVYVCKFSLLIVFSFDILAEMIWKQQQSFYYAEFTVLFQVFDYSKTLAQDEKKNTFYIFYGKPHPIRFISL